MPPLGELFRPLRPRGLRDERREHLTRGVRPEEVERLERLVREVDGVAAVDEHMVGDRREHRCLDRGQVRRLGQRGLERAPGRIGGTSLDEAPIPRGQARHRYRLGRKGPHREARRLIAGVVRHERQTVHEGERAVVGVEVGEEVGHGDEHRQARAPPCASIGRAEVDTRADDFGGAHARVEQAEHRLRNDERDALFQSVAQARLEMSDRIGVGTRLDEHVAVAHGGHESAGVVGPHVERASRNEVEARVVPVARDEAGLDRALVKREAEVRAAVFDRVGRAFVPEHDDGHRPHLGEQPALLLQLGERPGPHLGGRLGRGLRRFGHPSPFCKCSIAII